MSRRIEKPNEAELEWIAKNVARATTMARARAGDPETSKRPSLEALDVLWCVVGDEIRRDQSDPNGLMNMLGLAFGQTLVDELGLEWAVVTDDLGTEIAVCDRATELLVFPTNLVAKRWTADAGPFLHDLYQAMRKDIEQILSQGR